jgi:RNA polymerase sigma-70 factor (ECF subfamily)
MDLLTIKNKAYKVDDEVLQRLIEVDKQRLYRIAYIYVKNEDDALEIVQEAIYKAFLNIKKLKQPEFFNTWITKIIVNASLDYIKKRNRLIYIAEEKELEKNAIEDMEYIDLYKSVDSLEGLYKTVIILKYFEDLKIKDIAKVLDITESNVKNYIHKALKQLRVDLKEDEYFE